MRGYADGTALECLDYKKLPDRVIFRGELLVAGAGFEPATFGL